MTTFAPARAAARTAALCLSHLPRIGLLVSLLLLAALPAMARGNDPWAPFHAPWFVRMGVNEGLPHSVTTAVVQDRQGLVWIGTMGGLVRYDGYRTELFEDRRSGRPALPDTYVRCLLALADGGVLVGTNAGGLARFDPRTGTFHRYPVGPGGTSDRKIYDLARDGDHGAWIATDRGIDHLDLRSDAITSVKLGAGAAPRNFSVFEDREGNLWAGNDRGLFVRRAGTAGFERPDRPDGVVATVLDNQIWAIDEDREGRIWVGSGQAGAAYRDLQGRWRPVPGFSGYEDAARRSTVRDLLETDDGSMWIGTDGAGIIAYRAGEAAIRQIDHDPARASSLPGDTVRGLLEDASGNLWAATDLGVAHADIRTRAAFAVLPSPLDPQALSDTNVHGIFVDSHGRVWLGLGMGRIDVIDLEHGQMRHLRLGGHQAHRDVQTFAESADGRIWVGTQGMARIDPSTWTVDDTVLPELDGQPVLSLLQDGPYLLIGTYDGVYRYDARDRRITHLRHRPGDAGSLASDTVRQIVRVGKEVWYATTRGISIAARPDQDSGFRALRHDPGDASSLPQDYVGGIARDARGRVWISTFGGLAVIDHYVPGEPVHIRTIGTAQGLASDKINAVLVDGGGNPWVSMSNGLARIDADTGAVHNLGVRDGQHIAGYIYIAAATIRGDLLFGGLGGLSVVRPHTRSKDTRPARLAITQAVLNGVALPPTALPGDGRGMTLDRSGRSLRVNFALLDYRASRETTYSYRMRGFDDGWTEIPRGTPPVAIYTNLPNGRYTLELRATTHGTRGDTVTARFPVHVTPLWYETLPFRIAVGLLAAAAIAGLVHLRTLYLRAQARRLQQQVDARTLDLQAANRRLDQLAGTDELSGLYNRRRFLKLAEAVRAQAIEGQACMALLDLDRFKLVNDTYGHLAGDAAIRAAADVVRAHCRHSDLAARFGGEELAICLPGSNQAQAMQVVERIREALDRSPVRHGSARIAVTVSIGVAAYRAG